MCKYPRIENSKVRYDIKNEQLADQIKLVYFENERH